MADEIVSARRDADDGSNDSPSPVDRLAGIVVVIAVVAGAFACIASGSELIGLDLVTPAVRSLLTLPGARVL